MRWRQGLSNLISGLKINTGPEDIIPESGRETNHRTSQSCVVFFLNNNTSLHFLLVIVKHQSSHFVYINIYA